MSWLIGGASMTGAFYMMLIFHPIENNAIQAICCVALILTYSILLTIAGIREDKINNRIAALEKKIDDIKKGGAE